MDAEHKKKYWGKSLDWSLPKVCRGRFRYMVMPAIKVVYIMVPNHVPKANKWVVTAAFFDIWARGERDDTPAKARAPRMAPERKRGELCNRCGVQLVGSHDGREFTTLP